VKHVLVSECRRAAAIIGLLLLTLMGSQAGQQASAQSLPSLAELATTIPSDASSLTIDSFILNGQPYASIRYTRNEPVYSRSIDRTFELGREYMALYRWDGSSWRKVLDGYPFAVDLYGSRNTGPLEAGRPTPDTALVSFHVTPLPQPLAEPGIMPDLLAIELRYMLGPNDIQHPAPTLVILRPTTDGFATVYTTDFNVRASIESIARGADSMSVWVPAYVNSPACCPDGTEYLALVWRDGRLVEAERCIRPGRSASLTSCANR
jgi:hypothetical protein